MKVAGRFGLYSKSKGSAWGKVGSTVSSGSATPWATEPQSVEPPAWSGFVLLGDRR